MYFSYKSNRKSLPPASIINFLSWLFIKYTVFLLSFFFFCYCCCWKMYATLVLVCFCRARLFFALFTKRCFFYSFFSLFSFILIVYYTNNVYFPTNFSGQIKSRAFTTNAIWVYCNLGRSVCILFSCFSYSIFIVNMFVLDALWIRDTIRLHTQ